MSELSKETLDLYKPIAGKINTPKPDQDIEFINNKLKELYREINDNFTFGLGIQEARRKVIDHCQSFIDNLVQQHNSKCIKYMKRYGYPADFFIIEIKMGYIREQIKSRLKSPIVEGRK